MAHTPTELAAIQTLLQTIWAPLLMGELRETVLLPRLVNTEYSPLILKKGDKVTVNMVKYAKGQTLTVNKATGAHRDIEAEELEIVPKDITANKLFTASFELDDLAGLLTELNAENANLNSPIRQALLGALETQINAFIYSGVAPHATNVIKAVETFNFTEFKKITKKASKLKWPTGNRVLLLDPEYYGDLSAEEKMSSADYVGTDLPMLNSSNAMQRSGFLIAEDNTDAMLTLAKDADGKAALAFDKNFYYFVAQEVPSFKVSDLHPTKKRGYLITVDLYGGGEVGIEGDKKHIVVSSKPA